MMKDTGVYKRLGSGDQLISRLQVVLKIVDVVLSVLVVVLML
ncbi:hypothetical protein JMUB7507_26600 [Staphylococcus aureus]